MAERMTVEEALAEMKKKALQAIEESLLMVEADAKLLCPVKTGTLRRSITHETRQDESKTYGAVGSNVEYALWAERKVPYLEPSVDKNMESIKRKIAEVLGNES